MGIVFDNMYPASFKGASFFYIGGDTTGGRKTVTFEYPNKDFRFIEDLGENLKTFTIRGIIQGLFYDFEKRALIDALSSPGIGTFVHPHFGNIQCVATGYTVTENLNNTGIAEFSMNFSQTEKSLFPNASRNNITAIADLFASIYLAAPGFLDSTYLASTSLNIISGANKLQSISKRLLDIANTVPAIKTSDTTFTQQANSFDNNSFKIAAPEGEIGDNTVDLISSFDGLTTDGESRFDASKQLIGFGSDDQFIKFQTREIIERTNNTKSINGTVNGLAFINLSDAAKDIDYISEDDLNDTANLLDDLYDELIDSTTNSFSNEFLDNINQMRNEVRVFFEQKRIIINKVIEIETNPIPMTILAYKYYGNTDEYDNLLSINQITNPARVSGTIKILEQ